MWVRGADFGIPNGAIRQPGTANAPRIAFSLIVNSTGRIRRFHDTAHAPPVESSRHGRELVAPARPALLIALLIDPNKYWPRRDAVRNHLQDART
jgi:hypothetical protein